MPPRRLNPKIPRDLETVVLKCLEKNPSRRYATAEALGDDLTRWLDGRPVQARPIAIWENAWRRCWRRPAVAGLTAVLAATVLVGFIVLFVYYRRADDQRLRAEAAHEQSEKNFKVASTVIDRLERLVFNGLDGSKPLASDQLFNAANVLMEQVARQDHSRIQAGTLDSPHQNQRADSNSPPPVGPTYRGVGCNAGADGANPRDSGAGTEKRLF